MIGTKSVKNVVYIHSENAGAYPPLDLYETDDSLVLEIDLPGIDPNEEFIRVCGNTVIIEGVKRDACKTGMLNYICMERTFESFRRVIKLPAAVNPDEGRALYRDGVIILKFPKLRERVIKIKIEK